MAVRHEGFVGRRAELSLIQQSIAVEAGRVVVVVGDAGVGKSRLVRAAVARAGVDVVTGSCLPLSSPLPLLPIVDVLAALPPPIAGSMPMWVVDEIARLVPPCDDNAQAAPAPVTAGDGWGQHRLFDAVGRRLDAHGRHGRRAVVVEDLHWADPATLDCLLYLLAPAHRPSLSMVVTVRADEPAPAVQRWLATLPSLPDVVRLDLEPLSEDETADLAEVLGNGRPVGLSPVDLHRRTRGNALFVEQILLHGDGTTEVPPGLAALLTARLDSVTGLARAVVDALAVAGRPLTEGLLAEVCAATTSEVGTAVQELSARHLLAPARGADTELRHALLGEVANDQLSPSARRALHSRLADALAAAPTSVPSSVVADHLAAAGRDGDQVRFRVAAGSEADRVGAATQAAAQYRRALDLWPARPGSDDDLADLFSVAWTATANAGDRTGAAELAERAWSALAERVGSDRSVRLLTALGHFRRSHSVAAGVAALDRALRVGANVDPLSLVHAHREYAAVLLSTGDFERARRHTVAALDLLPESGPAAERLALTAIDAWLLAAVGRATESDRRHAEVDETSISDPATRLELAGRTGDLLLDSGRLADAVRRGTAALGDAAKEGLGSSYWASIVRFNIGEALLEQGRTPVVLALLDQADEPATLGITPVRLMRADAYLHAGNSAAAEGFWRQIPLDSAEPAFRREYTIRHLEFVAWTSAPSEEALAALDEAIAVLARICRGDQSQFVAPLLTAAMRVCADITEHARDAGTPARDGDRRADVLLDLVAAAPRDPFGGHLIPVTARAHGLSWTAELARQRGAAPSTPWAGVAQAWDELGRPHRAGYGWWREARAGLSDPRRRNTARRAVAAAAGRAPGHEPLAHAVRELSKQARFGGQVSGAADREPVEAGDLRSVRGAKLTPREADVLALIAAGRSNAEIGAALFISASTAGVHVSNILRKLGVRTRVEAAVIAARQRSD